MPSRVLPGLPRAVVLLVSVLALAACGGTGSDGEGEERDDRSGSGSSAAPAAGVSPCGELTDADVERLTGLEVTHRERELPGGGATCTFTSDGAPVVMVLTAVTDEGIDDLVDAARVGDEDQTSTEPVEIEGTTDAVLLTDSAYDLATTSVVATTGEVGYTVYGSGPTSAEEGRVAVAALTILLGGESDAPAAAAAQAPCDALTAEEVSEVLGARFTAEEDDLGTADRGLPACFYTGPGEVDVTALALDRTAPLESLTAGYARTGADVEELDVEGLSAAYLVLKPTGSESADLYVAAPGGTYGVTVRAETREQASRLARELAPALG